MDKLNTRLQKEHEVMSLLSPYHVDHQQMILLTTIPFSQSEFYQEMSPSDIVSKLPVLTLDRIIKKLSSGIPLKDYLVLEKTLNRAQELMCADRDPKPIRELLLPSDY